MSILILNKLLKLKAIIAKQEGFQGISPNVIKEWLPYFRRSRDDNDSSLLKRFAKEVLGLPDEYLEKSNFFDFGLDSLLTKILDVPYDDVNEVYRLYNQQQSLPSSLEEYKKLQEVINAPGAYGRTVRNATRRMEEIATSWYDAGIITLSELMNDEVDISKITPELLKQGYATYEEQIDQRLQPGTEVGDALQSANRQTILNNITRYDTPFRTVFEEGEIQGTPKSFEEQREEMSEAIIDKIIAYEEIAQYRKDKGLNSPTNIYWELLRTLHGPYENFYPDHPAGIVRVEQDLLDNILKVTEDILRNPDRQSFDYYKPSGEADSLAVASYKKYRDRSRERDLVLSDDAPITQRPILEEEWSGQWTTPALKRLALLYGYDEPADFVHDRTQKQLKERNLVGNEDLGGDFEAAQNPETHPEKLANLARRSNDVRIRQLVAGNPNAPTSVLLQLGVEFPKQFFDNPIFPYLILEDPSGFLSSIPRDSILGMLKAPNVPKEFLDLVATTHSDQSVAMKAEDIRKQNAGGGGTADTDTYGTPFTPNNGNQSGNLSFMSSNDPAQTNQATTEPATGELPEETPEMAGVEPIAPDEISEDKKEEIKSLLKKSNLRSTTKSFLLEILK